MIPEGFAKVTLSYIGDHAKNWSADGKVWFSVDGEAILSRETHMSLQGEIARVSGTPCCVSRQMSD